jgi:hypothetical protein
VGKKGSKDFVLVHSKKNGDGYINDSNKAAFIDKMKAAMKQ